MQLDFVFFEKSLASAFEINDGPERLGSFRVRHFARQIKTSGILVFRMDQPDFHGQRPYLVILDKLGERQDIFPDFRQPFREHLFGQVFPFHIVQ